MPATAIVKSSTALNLSILALLAAIAIGVFTSPVFNYKEVLSRQTETERRVQELSLQIDANIRGREQIIQDFAPVMDECLEGFKQVSERVSRIEIDLKTLGQLPVLSAWHSENSPDSIGALEFEQFAARYTDEIELPKPIERFRGRFDPDMIAQGHEDDFVDKLLQTGLFAHAAREELPGDVYDQLVMLFGAHKTIMNILNHQRSRVVSQVIATHDVAGNYRDVPVDDKDGLRFAQRAMKEGKSAGILRTVKLKTEGVRRVYYVSYDENPEVEDFNTQAVNSAMHMLRDSFFLLRDTR